MLRTCLRSFMIKKLNLSNASKQFITLRTCLRSFVINKINLSNASKKNNASKQFIMLRTCLRSFMIKKLNLSNASKQFITLRTCLRSFVINKNKLNLNPKISILKDFLKLDDCSFNLHICTSMYYHHYCVFDVDHDVHCFF
jgi:hypothetical protein